MPRPDAVRLGVDAAGPLTVLRGLFVGLQTLLLVASDAALSCRITRPAPFRPLAPRGLDLPLYELRAVVLSMATLIKGVPGHPEHTAAGE